jgi:hypothetical protein
LCAVAVLLTACQAGADPSGADRNCSLVGADSGVQVDYGPALAGRSGRFTVEACALGDCHSLPGVSARRQRVLMVAMHQVHDATPVTVRVTITDARGREVFHGRQQVTPHKIQPNGPSCPPTAWVGRLVASGRHTLT